MTKPRAPRPARPRRRRLPVWATLLVPVGTLLGGCYDAEALIEARHEHAIRGRVEEVPLGFFRVTLPQPSATTAIAEIHFRAFGRVSLDEVEAVHGLLEEHRPELEHRTLLAIRRLEQSEFEDPKLTRLRTVIADTVNELLENSAVKSVGFYSFGFSNYH